MRLRGSSFVAYMAYWPYGNVPTQVSLCALFRRCVKTLLTWLLMWLICCLVIVTSYVRKNLRIRRYRREEAQAEGTYEPGLFTTIFYAVKNKVCPIIQIDRES